MQNVVHMGYHKIDTSLWALHGTYDMQTLRTTDKLVNLTAGGAEYKRGQGFKKITRGRILM